MMDGVGRVEGDGRGNLPEKSKADVYEEIGAAAGDEEDAEGWDWRGYMSVIVR